MERGLAVRCGACRGGGWLEGWFRRCRYCRARGWFDPTTAPGGVGALVAAADALRTGAAAGLLVRPALPWERWPIPTEVKGHEGAPDEPTWERAVRASAVILYELPDGREHLAGGLELSRLDDSYAALRDVLWQTDDDGGLLRCIDRELADLYLRLSFFPAWRGTWLELTRHDPDAKKPPPPPRPAEITGEAQKYVTGKFFVGVPAEET